MVKNFPEITQEMHPMTDNLDARALLEGTTPGPWIISEWGIEGVLDPLNGHVYDEYDSDSPTISVNQANARLIAAAPDLAREVITLRERVAVLGELARDAKIMTRREYHRTLGDCADILPQVDRKIDQMLAALNPTPVEGAGR